MRSKHIIEKEIAALRALRPVGKFSAETQNTIDWMIEELEYGVDDTAGEWDEMDDEEQDAVMEARRWKEGESNHSLSSKWGDLVQHK